MIFHGAQARAAGIVDGLEHRADGEANVVHRGEDGVVDRVQAHCQAIEPRLVQPASALGREERAVGGEGQVFQSGDRSQHADEVVESLAQQRLSAGQPDLAHPVVDEERASRTISSNESSSRRGMNR